MSRWGRVFGAALGLLLVAAPIAPVRAQTGTFTAPPECTDPPPADVEDGMTVFVTSPSGVEPRTTPAVPVEATFTNTSENVIGQRDGEVTKMRAFALACAAGQIVPEAPPEVTPDGEPETATFIWDPIPSFVTNGRYAIVVEADGTSSRPGRTQHARSVVHVRLAVPPAKPTSVEASEPANGVVTVSWEYANPEPDLIGFEVRRARQGSGDYTTVKNGIVGAKARSVSDEPPAGAWRYHVVAYRNGAPEGAVSRDDTVEVPEASPSASPTGAGTGAGTGTGTGGESGGGSTSGDDGDGSPATATTAQIGSSDTPRASVDLSRFAAALNAQRQQPAGRLEPPDPGFQETLPFDPSADLESEEEPAELGADEPGVGVGVGQTPEADPAERRRSLGFVAFGLLLFVLSMTGLFVKGEVKRADLLALEAVEEEDLEGDLGPVAAASPAVDVERPPALPRRSRAARAAAAAAAVAVVAPPTAPEADPTPRRRRRAQLPVEEPAVVAPVPEVDEEDAPTSRRRRWGQRTIDADLVAPSAAPVNGFDDLRDRAEARNARRAARSRTNGVVSAARRPYAEAPLDAPGLDIPDPAPVRSRRR